MLGPGGFVLIANMGLQTVSSGNEQKGMKKIGQTRATPTSGIKELLIRTVDGLLRDILQAPTSGAVLLWWACESKKRKHTYIKHFGNAKQGCNNLRKSGGWAENGFGWI